VKTEKNHPFRNRTNCDTTRGFIGKFKEKKEENKQKKSGVSFGFNSSLKTKKISKEK
jgi:hypothetical protein